MDVVAIQASPRPTGHSARLLNQLLDALGTVSLSRIEPDELLVDPCRSCGDCIETGLCPLAEPRLAKRLEALWNARLVILASPVYFLGPPGPLKLFMDRSQPLWARTYRLSEKRPREARALAILSAAGSGPGAFDAYEAMLQAWFHSLGIRQIETVSFACLELDAPLPSAYVSEVRRRGRRLAGWLAASPGTEGGAR